MSDATSPPDFLEKLWERKFLQFFGSYLAVGFGLLQFLEFLVNRYGISSAYIDKYLVLWLVSIPAVAVLIYYQGRLPRKGSKGRRSWQRWVVPANLGISGLLAVMLFGGDARAEVVTTTDETGQSIAAVVPKANKVKYISVFGFDKKDGKEHDWLSVGIPYLLAIDLRQRPDLYPSESIELTMSHYDKLGFKPLSHLNVAAQRRIAQQARSQYFVSGSYEVDAAGVYKLEGAVQRTRDGKKLFDLSASDTDIFAAIGQIGEQVINGLPDPLRNDDKVATDLPVAALITDQVPALKALMETSIHMILNPQDMAGGLELARRSDAADPNCSICKFTLANMLLGVQKRDSSIQLMREAVRMSSTLPQREQIGIRSLLYSMEGDLDKYYDLMEMGRKLFPYDYDYYEKLAGYYHGTKGPKATMELMEEAVANGHEERGLLMLSDLHRENNDYAKAKEVLDRFFKLYPDRTEDRLRYVTLYERQNQLDRAREVLEELTTLDPTNLDYQFKITDLLLRQTKYDEAISEYQELLATATSTQDTFRALNSLAAVYHYKGMARKALSVIDELETAMKRAMPLPNALGQTINPRQALLLSINREETLDSLVEVMGGYFPEMAQIFSCIKIRTLVQEDWANRPLAEEVRACRDLGLQQGMTPEALDFITAYAERDYALAAKLLTEGTDAGTVLTNSDEFKVETYLRAEQPERAREILETAIGTRGEIPDYLVQRYRLEGNEADLNRALELWRDADNDFIPAMRARDLAGARVQ